MLDELFEFDRDRNRRGAVTDEKPRGLRGLIGRLFGALGGEDDDDSARNDRRGSARRDDDDDDDDRSRSGARDRRRRDNEGFDFGDD